MLRESAGSQRVLAAYQIALIPMAQQHQLLMRCWRNQEEIREQMLSQATISEEQQHNWFEKVKGDPTQSHWVIRFRDHLIGATNVKSLEEGKSVAEASILEPGLYIGERRFQSNIIAFAPTLALYDYCFEQLGTKRFRAVVKRNNVNAINYNQKLGYEIVEDKSLCVLELEQEGYRHATATIRQFLSRSRKKK